MEEKRKRGRPRTRFIDENQVKRPRGRPRKEVDPNEVKVKRPRGRPKKEGSVQRVKGLRPRGRPRKNSINDVELFNTDFYDSMAYSQPMQSNMENQKITSFTEDTYKMSNQDVITSQDIAEAQGLFEDFSELDEIEEAPAKNKLIQEAQRIEKKQSIGFYEPDVADDEDVLADETEQVGDDSQEQQASINNTQELSKKQQKLLEQKELEEEMKRQEQALQEQKEKELQEIMRSNVQQSTKVAYGQMNKVIVITGATSGMGLAMAKDLVGLGQTVIGIGRRPSVCRDARNEILSKYPEGKIHYLVADLSLMSQVRILADEIKNKLAEINRDCVDVLIHNAGIDTNSHKLTYENNEIMWATNYLSVFLLTRELQAELDRSKDARVITITNSRTHKTQLNWKDIRGTTNKSNEKVYDQTKLADLMFAIEYDHRCAIANRTDLHAYCVDPGMVNTQFNTKSKSGFRRWFLEKWGKKGKTVEQGIETTIYLCLAEKLPKNIVFYSNKKPTEPCKYALDPRNRAALWRYSEMALSKN